MLPASPQAPFTTFGSGVAKEGMGHPACIPIMPHERAPTVHGVGNGERGSGVIYGRKGGTAPGEAVLYPACVFIVPLTIVPVSVMA